ncbi:MAG: hypothetical protein ACJ74Q_21455 [Pyrinomonadaceae bacterium]
MSTPESQIPDFNSFAATRAPDFNSFAASRRAAPSASSDARPARAQLPPVDSRLDSFVNDVMGEASKRSGYTYKLGEGSRTPEQQAGKVAAGYSRTYHSKHLTGHGRDVLAFDASGNYITDGAHDAYKTLGDVYREKAAAAGLPIRWGGDFHDFHDPGHFEIEDDGGAVSAPAAAPADVPDFNSFAASRDVPDFEDWKAQRAGGDDEVVTINARNAVTPAPPPAPALPERQSFDVRTMEGRARRDSRAALERTPGAYLEVSVPVSNIEHADGSQLVRDAYRSAVEARGVPGEFFDEWTKANAPEGYHIRSGRGEELTAADAYDEGSRSARLRLDANHVSQIVDAYKRSRGTFGRLKDWAASDEESSGEKVLDAAGAVGGPVARAAGYVARPFQATSAGVFAAARGDNPLPVAYKTLTTGETPAEGTNPVGNFLRDSALLARINPRLGRVLGGGADILLDPANLIGLGILGKGAKAASGFGRIGRAVEEVNALGRSLGVLERGLVDARPLGLAAAGAGEGGDVAALEDRLSRVLEVTRKLKAGEALTPEETALHTEVRAAAEAAPSSAVRDEQLRYARERAELHEREAERLTNPDAKAHARAMADDYAREAERLQAGSAAPPVEGYDVADARASRFQQPATDGPPAPLWKRAASNTRAVVQLPKAKAGFDLSATGRQGLAQALAHPTYLKEAFAHQVKAFASEDLFNNFAQAIRNRPDFELMNKSGLFLSSTGPEAEEAFASKLAQKIPGVRASDRAYSAALDSVRTQAWDNYVSSLPKHLRDNPETLKAVSELINVTTGRGVVPILDRSAFGKKIINALNVPFFSPRNTASKFNLISPARLAKNMMSAETRPVALLQLRDASRGLATLGTTLGLMHFAGLDVGLNPFSKDNNFGKLRVGKAVYDLTGGEGNTVRYLAQMARLLRRNPRNSNKSAVEITGRYLRSQLQPLAAAAVDVGTGKTFEGKPASLSGSALDLIVPFVIDDILKGFREEGILGAAKATPGVLGVGVNFYDKPKEKGKRGGVSASPAAEPAANYMQLQGEPVSRNVEDRREPEGDSAPYTAEDHRVLVEERTARGAPAIDDAQAGAVALLLDGMPEREFGRYARAVDETVQTGRVGEVVTHGAETAARTLGYKDAADAHRFQRMLAEERRLRPVQFYFDAAAGRYGERMRSEAMEGVYYPENHLPTPAPSSSSSPAHDEIRGAVEGADPDAEPTFRDFPEGMGESRVPRSAMPQVKSVHRGAMVQFLKGRGVSHTQEEVPAGSLRPSQAEYSPEKVKRALSFDGPDRAILVSSDNYVADGHHQWLSALHEDPSRRIPVIRLDAPINQLLLEMARFPSSGVDDASA